VPPFAYPSYEALSDSTRDKLLQLAGAVDTKKFSPRSLELINQLKGILAHRQ